MPTLFLQCYDVCPAYAEPQTCNLIQLKLRLNVIHFQICRFHKGSLLFPTTMMLLHPGPCYSINSGHFGSFFPVTFRPLLQTHQNFRLYSFQTMASKFPEDQGSDLSKHPAVTTYVAPPVTNPLTQRSSSAWGGECQTALAPRYQPTILRMGITTSSKYIHFSSQTFSLSVWP